MLYIKPGQFCTINHILYRAKKRTHYCDGCDLNSVYVCPNIKRDNTTQKRVSCAQTGIIFKRV